MSIYHPTPAYVFILYRLLNESQLEILAFQRALKECVLSVDDAYGKSFEEFYVGFEGRLVYECGINSSRSYGG